MLRILGVREVDQFESYLGLPTLIGRAKYPTFSFLNDKVWKKLQGWKGTLLSRASKEILIKAVAQSIHTYTISVFQIPMKLCDELVALCAKFWWGKARNERKIHWRSWDKLSTSKKDGRMGFHDLRAINLAMLSKQGWRMIQETNSLLYRCFKARYFPRTSFLEAVESPNNSYVWKSMLAAPLILKSSHCWRVGNGCSIQVQGDKWIPNFPSHRILHPPNDDVEGWVVVDLIDHELHE
ncbi:uncharacterized mitochondrial protein AtMg00310-like [Quercus suber]|uniref:uncharacterized mitochondrial protein AtMg00310-like n=1 Tax=Quercus suber TaxID=58331 RepID=UPI000CE22831|nr:uncharacterized protein LOC111991683 [Quercus suber]